MEKQTENQYYNRATFSESVIEYAEKLLEKLVLSDTEASILQTIIKTVLSK